MTLAPEHPTHETGSLPVVSVRFSPDGTPLAVRHDGRIWMVDPALHTNHWYSRAAWWETRNRAPRGTGDAEGSAQLLHRLDAHATEGLARPPPRRRPRHRTLARLAGGPGTVLPHPGLGCFRGSDPDRTRPRRGNHPCQRRSRHLRRCQGRGRGEDPRRLQSHRHPYRLTRNPRAKEPPVAKDAWMVLSGLLMKVVRVCRTRVGSTQAC